jgi:hypothetical protein
MDEKRAMMEVANPREKLLLLMLNSLGGRRGIFWFPVVQSEKKGKKWDYMALKHVTFMECGCARVVLYPGETEEYVGFLTPETVRQLQLTLDLRRQAREVITPDSPVMRDAWSMEGGFGYLNANRAEPLKDKSVSTIMRRLRVRAGIMITSKDGGWKVCHGFRKDYKNSIPSCPKHGESDKEMLLGHLSAYDRPDEVHLHEQFHRGIPNLTVSKADELKAELQSSQEKHESEWKASRLENLELKNQVAQLTKNQEAFARVLELLQSGAKVDPALLNLKKEDLSRS